MNLTVSPMNLNSCNCPKPQVNFESIPIKKIRRFGCENGMRPLQRERDMVADVFSDLFEKQAKEAGLNTKELENQGYKFEFIPKTAFEKDMFIMLQRKNGTSVAVTETGSLPYIRKDSDALACFVNETVKPFVEKVMKKVNPSA